MSASLIGEDVKVIFDAETPYADLEHRVMHLRPLPEEVSDEALLHLRADCDHEMGHFGFTDPKALTPDIRPIVKLIANAIEDGFIERKVSDRWLGCAQNLAGSNAALCKQLREKFSDNVDPSELDNALRALAINGLQILSFGGTLQEVYDTFGDEIAPLYVPVADLLPRLAHVKRTQDSVYLARQLADRWRWGRPDPPAPKLAKSASVGARGSGSPLGGDEEMTVEELEAETLIAEAMEPSIIGELRKAKIRNQTFVDHYRYRAFTDDDQEEELAPTEDADAVGAFVDSVRHVVPPLRRRLIMEFSGVGDRFQRNLKRGELDQRALHKVAFGSDRVFRQKVPKVVVDADVTLLVDASGSMLGRVGEHTTKLHVAAQTACAFSMVLDHIGVPHECAAFSTSSGMSRAYASFGEYERLRPLRHYIVKPAGRTFRQSRAHFAALAAHARCYENIDGESVLWAARRLAARNRPGMKPILIVVSDGWPASSPENHSVLNTHLKRTVERIEKAGIACVGIGIGTDSVKRFYKTFTVIDDVSDLVGTSYSVIRAALRGAIRH